MSPYLSLIVAFILLFSFEKAAQADSVNMLGQPATKTGSVTLDIDTYRQYLQVMLNDNRGAETILQNAYVKQTELIQELENKIKSNPDLRADLKDHTVDKLKQCRSNLDNRYARVAEGLTVIDTVLSGNASVVQSLASPNISNSESAKSIIKSTIFPCLDKYYKDLNSMLAKDVSYDIDTVLRDFESYKK